MALKCKFDKATDIPIPQDPTQLFIECYLQDSLPPRLLLSRTQGYFDSVALVGVTNAKVTLTAPDGAKIALSPGIYFSLQERKAYNWGGPDPIYLKAGDKWRLDVVDTNGVAIWAESIVMPKIRIDSITYQARDNDTLAYCATWQKDPSGQTNFYRMVANQDSLSGSSLAEVTFQDNFRNGEEFPIRTGFAFGLNHKAYIRVFALEPTYYDFVQSVNQAQRNNGNPFSQPNRLKSAIHGGLGVFTSLVYDKRTFVLAKRSGKIL